MNLCLNRYSVVDLILVFLMGAVLGGCKSTQGASISGSALYLEKIALPPNATFEATLEEVSRIDSPAKILGKVVKSSFGQVPVYFTITYDQDSLIPGPFSDFPLHFLGLLPGNNCENQYQLDLFSNNAYFLRAVCFKDGESQKTSDDIGRWSYDEATKELILSGDREGKDFFAVLDSKTIEKLTSEGVQINSTLNFKLEDSRTAKTIEPRVFMHGMYQYTADEAIFRECLTGFKLPVVFEGDHAALERAYLGSHIEPGSPLKVHLDGSIVQRQVTDGTGTKAHLLVDHFIKTIPRETCGNPYSTASLTNTYWRLTELNGLAVGRMTPMLREAHLVFHNEHKGVKRVAGSTSCNSLSGTYKLVGHEIYLDQEPLAMTMMACPEGNIEKEFVTMLKEVKGWKISGEHLVLFGDDELQILGRFEATYLR